MKNAGTMHKIIIMYMLQRGAMAENVGEESI